MRQSIVMRQSLRDPNLEDKYKEELKKYRKTVSFGQNDDFKAFTQESAKSAMAQTQSTSTIRKSIARASVSFNLADGTESGDLVIENERLKTTITILNGKLKSQQDTDEIIQNLRVSNENLESENKKFKSTISSLESMIESLNERNSITQMDLKESEEARRLLKVEIESMSQKMIYLEEELYESKSTVLELLDSIKALEIEIETQIGGNDDLRNENENLRNENESFRNENESFRNENENLRNENEDLRNENENIKIENENLIKNYVHKVEYLQDRVDWLNDDRRAKYAIYHGKKGDNTDMILSEFLNRYPERDNLKIMFLRETEGVYYFGKKRVYIKVEKGNCLMVRVGGGYIPIDDFIEQYTQVEVDKVDRGNVIDHFDRKTSLQKIASRKAEGARETSPIRSPVRFFSASSQQRKLNQSRW